MRLGLDVSQHQLSWPQLLERVRFAERAGFEGVWLFDHFKALYGDPKGPCMEAWTLLAALAAATERIRFGALVTGVTYRHPSILATEAITIDNISTGRLEIGIGAAWFGDEHRELGVDFPPARERAGRLEEAIEVMKALMTTDGTSLDGRYYRLDNATYRPRPVQQPHPPIWVGAGGEQLTIPIAARHADVWHAFGSIASLRRKSAILDEHAQRAGREPSAITRSTNLSLSEPMGEVADTATQLRDAGFSYLIASWPAAGQARIEEFLDEVVPELS
jgi:F420-dependent oxidoreductase-like protein